MFIFSTQRSSQQQLNFSIANLGSSHPNLATVEKTEDSDDVTNSRNGNGLKMIQTQSSSSSLVSRKDSQEKVQDSGPGPKIQTILNAATSIATKVPHIVSKNGTGPLV